MTDHQKRDLAYGFNAGNYAHAYDGNKAARARRDTPEFQAAFIIGYYSSYEPHEIPADDLEDVMSALYEFGEDMEELGIAIDWPESDTEDSPDPDRDIDDRKARAKGLI